MLAVTHIENITFNQRILSEGSKSHPHDDEVVIAERAVRARATEKRLWKVAFLERLVKSAKVAIMRELDDV